MRKIRGIIDQLKQYAGERKYAEHYLQNIARIILAIPIIDYRVISHENKIVHSWFAIDY